MKCIIIFVLCLPVTLAAQKVALLDRGFKRPILFTDSATLEHMEQDYFPVRVEDLRSILKTTDWLVEKIDQGGAQAKIDNRFPAGQSTFICSESMVGRYSVHNIVLSTRTLGFITSLKLVQFDDSRKRALQKLLIFTDYVKNNLAGADEVRITF